MEPFFSAVNPEAIGVFGLFATVICFGLEQIGVGVTKDTDPVKMQRTLGYIAIVFGAVCQLFTSVWFFAFNLVGDHSKFLGTVFGFFGLFWLLVGIFFIKGGDKKMMANFFIPCLILNTLFLVRCIQDGLIFPLGIAVVVIELLLLTLIPGWYTGNPKLSKLAGVWNLVIAAFGFFLLYPHVLG